MDRITRADWDAQALKLARTAAFLTRLRTPGFGEIALTVGDRLLFRARKPRLA